MIDVFRSNEGNPKEDHDEINKMIKMIHQVSQETKDIVSGL